MNDREAFEQRFEVPRGTMAQFESYADLLAEWQLKMNLVGPSTLPTIWHRHFADSAQLLPLAGRGKSWLDIGAGAGFPGLVIALLDPQARLTLVESIAKKCRFLAEVVDRLDLGSRVNVENRRVETLPAQKFDIITARALANLSQLFEWGLGHADAGTRWLLPKGARTLDEIAAAGERFRFDHELVPSITEPAASIVIASKVRGR